MIRIKNIVKVIFILLAILIIAIWFQFFHRDFFSESNQENAIDSTNNEISNSNITQESKEKSTNRDMAISIGENLYNKISNFNFELGDFNAEQGATEVLNIEQLKEYFTVEAFENFIESYGIEKDDNEKYWDVGSRENNDRYLSHHELEINKIGNEKIDYIVTEYYAKNMDDVEKGFSNLNAEQMETQKSKFTIIKVNNEWKISEYSNPK